MVVAGHNIPTVYYGAFHLGRGMTKSNMLQIFNASILLLKAT